MQTENFKNAKDESEKILISISESAKILDVVPSTLRNWLSKKKVIPMQFVRKLGRRTLIHKKSLIEWLDTGCKKDLNAEKQKGNR